MTRNPRLFYSDDRSENKLLADKTASDLQTTKGHEPLFKCTAKNLGGCEQLVPDAFLT